MGKLARQNRPAQLIFVLDSDLCGIESSKGFESQIYRCKNIVAENKKGAPFGTPMKKLFAI